MSPTGKVVIGANYGDEGKGSMTNYLSSPDTIVIRFNGGAQASHTVTTRNHVHAFRHIGSGTFRGAATYLSKHFIINAIVFRQEWEALERMGVNPVVYCSREAIVSTPHDMIMNQFMEEDRGGSRHGSCGMGINETVTRILDGGHRSSRTGSVHAYYKHRAEKLGMNHSRITEFLRLAEATMPRYQEDLDFFNSKVIITGVDHLAKISDKFVFEGAQGLGLDEINGEFPHVTRSRTGLTNVLPIAKELGINELEVVYVSRSYVTRHGAGPLESEIVSGFYPKDPTNVPNRYQGKIRYGNLNLTSMLNRIFKDLTAVVDKINLDPCIAFTCLDQLDIISSVLGLKEYDERVGFHNEKKTRAHAPEESTFMQLMMEQDLQIPIRYTSSGPGRMKYIDD
jgi:adenylosuccinate synthase